MKNWLLALGMKIANSPGLLVLTLAGNIMGCGLIYALIEHHGPIQGMWWAVVTGSTVGYGDQYPVTTPGRGLGAWLIVTSILLVAVGTAQLASKLIVDSNVFSDDEQEELKHNVQVIAELLTHMKAKTCLCIWDDHQQPIQVNPLCSVHAKENDGRSGDRDVLHGERVHPGPDEEAERRGAAFRREVSVAGRGDHSSDGGRPGQG